MFHGLNEGSFKLRTLCPIQANFLRAGGWSGEEPFREAGGACDRACSTPYSLLLQLLLLLLHPVCVSLRLSLVASDSPWLFSE